MNNVFSSKQSPGHPRSAPERLLPTPDGSSEAIQVLLVEDEVDDAELLRRAFRRSPGNFSITHAEMVRDAERLLATTSVDIIVADLGLPDSHGMDTVHRLLEASRGVPLVMLTGLDDEETAVEAIKAGAKDFLLKSELHSSSLWRVVRYVLERTNLERELVQAQKREAIGRLAGGIAHEYNNILTVISGHVGLLLQDPLTEPWTPALQSVYDAAKRASHLTRQLLTYGRRRPVRAEPMDLNALLSGTAEMLRPVLPENIHLNLRLDEKVNSVLGDRHLIEQIAVNLILNARDALSAGGSITLETSDLVLESALRVEQRVVPAGQYVCCTVTDTGSGIPNEILGKIFDPFFTTKDVNQGTGLGLSTVSAIVEQHRGWINVRSRMNAGTTFSIFLPASSVSSEKVPAGESASGEQLPEGSGETILLVEDDEAVLKLATLALKHMGYRVFTAANGQDALMVWKTVGEEVDVLVTDLVMPGQISGLRLATQLVESRPDLPVVFMSGHCEEMALPELQRRPNWTLLQKPFPLPALAAAVRQKLRANSAG